MRSTKWLGVLLAICVSLGAAHAQDLSSVATKDLISKLQDESAPGIGMHETGYLGGFIAIEAPIFYGGMLGPVKPVASPVMRELVRRGVAALPTLLDHLSDSRPTKLATSPRYRVWFRTGYDPRNLDRLPEEVNTWPVRRAEHYALKVGDFCFVAAGQIVNREQTVVQPGDYGDVVEVDSPVEVPALAAEMKKDWGGLTAADHERFLEQEAQSPPNNRPYVEAVKRLMFYYPEAGAALAVRFLNRPLCDMTLVSDFVEQRLLKAKDEGKQDRLIAQFRKENGEANYGAMQLYLANCEMTPGVDSKHPPLGAGQGFWWMQSLVDALAAFRSEEIDQAVDGLLKRTSEMHPASLQSVTERCKLVHACAWRLTEPGARDAFEKSYGAVMASLPRKPQSGNLAAFSKRFQAFLDDEIGKLAPK